MIDVEAAGGVLYRTKGNAHQVVLIYRNDIWDLPKGKKENEESVETCACREVSEEIGIALPSIEDFLTETYHEYRRNGRNYGKTTYWYKMSTSAGVDFTPQTSEGITAVEWVDLDEAVEQVGFNNLKKVLNLFRDSL